MVIIAKFASICTTCKNTIPVGTAVNWIKGVKGVNHADVKVCAMQLAAPKAAVAVPAAAPRPAVTANAKPVAAFLQAARDRGLSWPKVVFVGPANEQITLKLAGAASTNPGAVFVQVNGDFAGSICADGSVRGRLQNQPTMLAALDAMMQNPAAAAKAYAQLTGNCSFCRKQLTDAGSLEVGYGPICAAKFGLPHTPAGKGVKVDLIAEPEADDRDDYAFDAAVEAQLNAPDALFSTAFEFDAMRNDVARANRRNNRRAAV